MTGTIALYNKEGERLHTTYLAAPPEYGKETFLNDMENKMKKTKLLFPKAKTVALADGARCNWTFFEKLTEYQVVDFYHATGYLGRFAKAVFPNVSEQKEWLDISCHKLKHNTGSAIRLLGQMEAELEYEHTNKDLSEIESAVSYFANNSLRMKYKKIRDMKMPIGSGVTEAACKVIVKERNV